MATRVRTKLGPSSGWQVAAYPGWYTGTGSTKTPFINVDPSEYRYQTPQEYYINQNYRVVSEHGFPLRGFGQNDVAKAGAFGKGWLFGVIGLGLFWFIVRKSR